jgi:hypothetical protein
MGQRTRGIGPAPIQIQSVSDEKTDVQFDKFKHGMDQLFQDVLTGNEILQCKLKANTLTQVEHGLGIKPKNWFILGLRNCAVVWQPVEANEKYLPLQATCDCEFSIKVF